MQLLSPMAGKAHFGTLLVPGLALARWAVMRRDALPRIMLAAALLAVLCSQNFMGDYVVCIAMWHGTVTWAALLLWASCGYVLYRYRRGDPKGMGQTDEGQTTVIAVRVCSISPVEKDEVVADNVGRTSSRREPAKLQD